MNAFPSHQMALMVNHPVFVKDLKNVICVCEFEGLGNITKAQKSLFCTSLQNLGITAIPDQSCYILTKGQLTVGLHVIARGLLGAGVKSIFLTAYGMKLTLAELQFLNNIQTPANSTSQYDSGINVDTNYIPLCISRVRGESLPNVINRFRICINQITN